MKKIEKHLANLEALGFDESHIVNTKYVWLKCSQCEAMSINGVATHERGCPNAVHECRGCNELIPMNQRYCAECR